VKFKFSFTENRSADIDFVATTVLFVPLLCHCQLCTQNVQHVDGYRTSEYFTIWKQQAAPLSQRNRATTRIIWQLYYVNSRPWWRLTTATVMLHAAADDSIVW